MVHLSRYLIIVEKYLSGNPPKSMLVFVLEQRGSSEVRHLPLVLKVPGSIPARCEENFGVRTHFLFHLQG